jgi:hypothetical protein
MKNENPSRYAARNKESCAILESSGRKLSIKSDGTDFPLASPVRSARLVNGRHYGEDTALGVPKFGQIDET